MTCRSFSVTKVDDQVPWISGILALLLPLSCNFALSNTIIRCGDCWNQEKVLTRSNLKLFPDIVRGARLKRRKAFWGIKKSRKYSLTSSRKGWKGFQYTYVRIKVVVISVILKASNIYDIYYRPCAWFFDLLLYEKILASLILQFSIIKSPIKVSS